MTHDADAVGQQGVGLKETAMNGSEKSLRRLIDKWLAPTPAIPVRVKRFSGMRSNQRRYVCVEASRSAGSLVIFFFRHDDGSWCVFPPATERPAMRAEWHAA
jgi:hypothetical protein